ncbi:MAG: hypothetical protein AAF252_08265 [Pseudomonadota bacterium]
MSSIELHPSELAYAFAYAKVDSIIGWGDTPFLPEDGDVSGWAAEGEQRLRAGRRLVGMPETGLNFSPPLTAAILALVNPTLVLLSERRNGDGVRRLSVHAAGSHFVGLIQRGDGMFQMTSYSDMMAAAGACAGFVGASLEPLRGEARVETTQKVLKTLHGAAGARTEDVIGGMVRLGLSKADAASAVSAFADPEAAGMLSVLYCAGNAVQDADPISVMTNAEKQTWTIFPPASLDGPMVLERSSVAALTARVAVSTAARFAANA